MNRFLEDLEKRHSVYTLSAQSTEADDVLAGELRRVLLATPSAYNMQSQRMVVLFGDAHKKLWDIVMQTLRTIVNPEKFPRTQKKIETFAAGHGSVLFFEDTAVLDKFKSDFPAYADKFGPWSLQQNGMLQVSCWAFLASKGMGASLQHYNPLIDDAVKAEWRLPKEWMLLAQMPFGVATAPADEKPKVDADIRFKVFD